MRNALTLRCNRRENTVLRSRLPPELVYVIPNALVADQFKPASEPPSTNPSKPSGLMNTVDVLAEDGSSQLRLSS